MADLLYYHLHESSRVAPSRSPESLLTRPKIITRPAKDSPWIETTRLQNSSLRVAIGYEGTGNSSIVTGDGWQNLLIVILRIPFDFT